VNWKWRALHSSSIMRGTLISVSAIVLAVRMRKNTGSRLRHAGRKCQRGDPILPLHFAFPAGWATQPRALILATKSPASRFCSPLPSNMDDCMRVLFGKAGRLRVAPRQAATSANMSRFLWLSSSTHHRAAVRCAPLCCLHVLGDNNVEKNRPGKRMAPVGNDSILNCVRCIGRGAERTHLYWL